MKVSYEIQSGRGFKRTAIRRSERDDINEVSRGDGTSGVLREF